MRCHGHTRLWRTYRLSVGRAITREYVGDTPTEMFKHVFQSLCAAMQCNLHIKARGENNHHLVEGVFKAFARALRQAIHRNVFSYELPSSKGTL